MKNFIKTLFVRQDGTPDTFMLVICMAISISLLFALVHEVLLWISVLSFNHLSESELKYMYDISFLYAVTIISELVCGSGYQISKRIFPPKDESNG